MVFLPYIKGLSEKIQKICVPYNIRTIFRSSSTLQRNLYQVKPNTGENMTKNRMYLIPCSCGREYEGERSHPLKLRIEKYRKAIVRIETIEIGHS